MSTTPSESGREGLKKKLLDILKQSAGSLVITSAIISPPTATATENPPPDKAVSARVQRIQDQIGQPQTSADGPQTMGWQFPLWGNWSDWNDNPWRDWGDWANHPWHNWGNWGNHQWHNWGDWNNHNKHHKHHHDDDD
jgi:hypothetical protein